MKHIKFTVTINEDDLEIRGYYTPGTEDTRDTPGTDPEFEVEEIYFNGYDITDLLYEVGGVEFFARLEREAIAYMEEKAEPDMDYMYESHRDSIKPLFEYFGELFNPNK